MNRNILKIIAVISMLIDHIGLFFLDNNIVCRCIGRIAMPIFAYFIAEGWKHTRNRKKYVLLIGIFAVITQGAFALLSQWYYLNILFTFLIAIALIYLIETRKNNTFIKDILLITTYVILAFLEAFSILDYGIFAIGLVLVFYFVKNKKWALISALGVLVAYSFKNYIFADFKPRALIQLFSILALIPLLFYNGENGKVNLKYLFYVFYPAHFYLIYLIQLLI